MRSALVVALASLALLVACKRESADVVDAGSGSAVGSASASTSPTPDDEARAAVDAIRASHAIACSIAMVDAAAHCHDEVKGFAAARKCYADGLAQAKEAQTRKPQPSAKLACAKTIEAAELGYIDGEVALLTDMLAWLDAHKAGLTAVMAARTLSEACDGHVKCDNEPSADDDRHSAASWASISAIECTKRLFTCGPPDTACWIDKVAARLGLACDPSENKPNNLRARVSGARLQ